MDSASHRARAVIILAFLLAPTTVTAGPQTYTEDFASSAYKDHVNNTADWNVAAGELRLFPFPFALAGALDTSGYAFDVCVFGDNAYVADGAMGLRIMDISDPATPVLSGTYDTPGTAYRLCVSGDNAYVADLASGLLVIDVSDPTTPALLGSYDTAGSAYDVCVRGDHAYVADSVGGLQVIDVSDPTTPTLAGTLDTPGYAQGVDVGGDHAFIADYSEGLQVVDISDPTAPALVGTYNTSGTARGIQIRGNWAYVADGASGLQLIDISDPTSPTLTGSYDTAADVFDVFVWGDRAFVTDGTFGIRLIDVSEPAAPTLVRTCDTPGTPRAVHVDGDHVYVADWGHGLQVIECAGLASPFVIGTYEPTGHIYDVCVSGDHAFVTNGWALIRVLDITDATSPALVGTYDAITGDFLKIDVSGDHAYVVSGGDGLLVLDISDPTSPTYAGQFGVVATPSDICVRGDYAYLASYGAGLGIVDISDPTSPTLVGTNDYMTGHGSGLDVAGHHVYLAHGEGGLGVIDISDPTWPTLEAVWGTPGSAEDVCVRGDHAYVADGSSGLRVIDISDPTSPGLAGVCATAGDAYGVDVWGNYAYVACDEAGLQVIDISDPTAPALAETCDTPGEARDVTVWGGCAFVAHRVSGLQVLRVSYTDVYWDLNRGQSIAVDGSCTGITRARLTSTETDGVYWGLSADAGTSWTPVVPDGAWTLLDVPGDDLMWRTVHVWPEGADPTVSDLTIDWLSAHPFITSVGDVAPDQGGRVLVSLERSAYDLAEEAVHLISDYNVWLRVDDTKTRDTILAEGEPVVDGGFGVAGSLLTWQGGHYLAPAAGEKDLPPGLWANVGEFPALQQQDYGFVVDTLADSTKADTAWAVYCITAHTAEPLDWYASAPDSGYSVDNIAPAVPTGLHLASADLLAWDDPVDADFQYFTVYGSDVDHPDGSEVLIDHTIGTSQNIARQPYWYFMVTAHDYTGNESVAAVYDAVSDVPDRQPTSYDLHQCVPNPFNPFTTISFDLPQPTRVDLRIYDLSGRLVCLLVHGEVMETGRREAIWNGCDDSGRRLASGTYFYRLDAEDFSETKRMVLVK